MALQASLSASEYRFANNRNPLAQRTPHSKMRSDSLHRLPAFRRELDRANSLPSSITLQFGDVLAAILTHIFKGQRYLFVFGSEAIRTESSDTFDVECRLSL